MTSIGVAGLLLGCAVSAAGAQDLGGALEGRVVDESGAPLSSVQVRAVSSRLQGPLRVRSNAHGLFLVPALPVGTYSLRLELPGYRSLVVQAVEVHLGAATALGDLVLSEAAVELAPLVVEIPPSGLEIVSTSIGASLRRATFERLPTERDYKSITTLLPQINQSFLGDETNGSGATGLENQLFVDGVAVTAPYKAATGTRLPYNFIEEIQVRQGGYEAEYGGALGTIVNAVTYTGTNEFDFRAFGYLSRSDLAGRQRPGVADLQVEDFSSFDAGFRASGPVIRDRLWFSTAYNPRIDRQDVEIPGFGPQGDRRTVHQFAGKLNWKPADGADLTFAAFGDPSTHRRVGPLGFSGPFGSPSALSNKDPFLGRRSEGGVNLSLHGVFRVRSDLTLEAKLDRHNRAEDEVGATSRASTEPLFIDRRTGVWSGGLGQRVDIGSRRNSLQFSASWARGSHALKGGFEYQANRVNKSEIFTEPGIIEFDGALYTTSAVRNVNRTHGRMPTVYLQDSWRISERVRLNAGLRWDGQYFFAAGDSVAQAFTKQWQPRVGLIFLPGDPGVQKLFAHYGRFYQRLPLSAFTIAHSQNDQRLRISDVDPRADPDSVLFEQTIVDPCCPAVKKVPGISGDHVDEFVLGYERVLKRSWVLGVRGTYRSLRGAFASGFAFGPGGPEPRMGTRGKGPLSFLPPGKRDYRALTLTLSRRADPWDVSAAYVLSRTTGNYTGQYDLDTRNAFPGIPFLVELASQAPNSSGLLPNDRPHVFKLTGAYDLSFGLDAGAFLTWQSGTPLSELGSTGFLFRPLFLTKRGSAGRMPSIWDVNLRLSYRVARLLGRGGASRLVLDLLHVGNPRRVVDVDQTRFRGVDPALGPLAALTEPYEVLVANQVAPNPNFGAALRHQPPMTLRLGLQMEF
ncbi:MAG: TonB-dependent receptor domain-containing protein [Gemmatimonadota bacterium]